MLRLVTDDRVADLGGSRPLNKSIESTSINFGSELVDQLWKKLIQMLSHLAAKTLQLLQLVTECLPTLPCPRCRPWGGRAAARSPP